jgi:NADPH:quinone reductase-like Zn-dependent oxidoreductase
MNAAVLRALGEIPRFEQFPDPVPGEGEVILRVCAAALKPVDKQLADGSHYASPRQLPAVCGTDGVGRLDDGTRVFFGGPRRPYGSMAEITVVPRGFCFSIPENMEDDTAAALPNPGVSAWLSLSWRARLVRGETVLILGATGVAGRLAIQIAKLLGATHVIAAGRNEPALAELHDLGADATIHLGRPDEELIEAFARAAGASGLHVVLDYLWGRPTELLLAALTRREFTHAGAETRLIQVGQGAGPTISLPAAVLRSTPLTILGTAGIPPRDALEDAYNQVMAHAARGELRVATELVPLSAIGEAWRRETSKGHRLVIIP